MAEPGWLKTISNHAVISRAELFEWLGIKTPELKALLTEQGFPRPRFGSFNKTTGERTNTSTSRWRVGDVRAWLEGSERLRNEIKTEIGAERSERTKRFLAALEARGVDQDGRPIRRQ